MGRAPEDGATLGVLEPWVPQRLMAINNQQEGAFPRTKLHACQLSTVGNLAHGKQVARECQ